MRRQRMPSSVLGWRYKGGICWLHRHRQPRAAGNETRETTRCTCHTYRLTSARKKRTSGLSGKRSRASSITCRHLDSDVEDGCNSREGKIGGEVQATSGVQQCHFGKGERGWTRRCCRRRADARGVATRGSTCTAQRRCTTVDPPQIQDFHLLLFGTSRHTRVCTYI